MKKQILTSILSLVFLVHAGLETASAKSHRRDRRENALVLKLREDASPEMMNALKELFHEYGIQVERKLLDGKSMRMKISNKMYQRQEEEIAQDLRATGGVEFAEPDFEVPPALNANDTYFSSQWHHKKIGSDVAWNYSNGSATVKIAVCDSGFELNHPDLEANWSLPGYNTVTDNSNVYSNHEHGTFTSGAIAAVGNNSLGISGVDWAIGLIPVQISTASNGVSTYSDVAECIRYAADRGARVVNVSYDYLYTSSLVNEAGQYLRARGGVLVVASGNNGVDISSWGESPNMLVVGSSDPNDSRSGFSNFGIPVDLIAPGENILTTIPGHNYGAVSGTSLSAPLVSGTAALLFTIQSSLTAAQAEQRILNSALDLGTAGKDPDFAGGRLRTGTAVKNAAIAFDATPPDISFISPTTSSTISGTVTITLNPSDNVGLSQVTLKANGTLVGTKTASPWTFSLNTTTLPNGSLTLLAEAKDLKGLASSASVTVTVNNASLPVITLDNLPAGAQDASRTFLGTWCKGNTSLASFGNTFLNPCGGGKDTYRFTPSIPETRNYKVYIRYLSAAFRSSSAPVTIRHALGTASHSVDMRTAGGTWFYLGTYKLNAGTGGYLEINDSRGSVSVDGAQFEAVP